MVIHILKHNNIFAGILINMETIVKDKVNQLNMTTSTKYNVCFGHRKFKQEPLQQQKVDMKL